MNQQLALMTYEIEQWLHNDPEFLEHVDTVGVAIDLLAEGLKPADVNTSRHYDLVRDTVERHDAKADER